MRTATIAMAALLVTGAGRTSVGAQGLTVRPSVVVEPVATLGVHLKAEVDRTRVSIGDYPRNWSLSGHADAPLLLDPDRNTETLRAQVGGGLEFSLFRPTRPAKGGPTVGDLPPWNYGYVALLGSAGLEAPQDMDTADITLGLVVAYEHDQYHRLWFLPQLCLGWDAVLCVECPEGHSSDDDLGTRLNGEVGWSIPADRQWMPGTLRPLWLRLRGRGFSAHGLHDAEPVRRAKGLWGSAEVAYRFDRRGPLHEVYVRSHGGRLPQQLTGKRATTAGLSLWF
jgi:hypothetical protein